MRVDANSGYHKVNWPNFWVFRATHFGWWDSGLWPTPSAVLDKARLAAAEAVRDQQPLTLPALAKEMHVHVRTLQAAARTGRLEVHYSVRSVFGRPLRLSTRAAGKAFLGDLLQ